MCKFAAEGDAFPDIVMETPDGGSVKVTPSLVCTAGWRFELGKASIPVDVVIDPLPPGRHLRVALVSGIDFGIARQSSNSSQPFNY